LHTSIKCRTFAAKIENNTINPMSTAALQDVYEGIMAYNLSAANKRWLAERLWEQADVEAADHVEPYTKAELATMVENGRKQIAEGRSYTSDQVLQMCENA
jgi:hypothetical protein